MGITQEEKRAWQDVVARESVRRLQVVADDLVSLVDETFEGRVSYTPDSGSDQMVLSFITKQYEHLRSLRALIDIRAHRDALLIARTMLEGLGRLRWAFNKEPERTDLWLWFGAILDWRQTIQNEQDGMHVEPEDKRQLGDIVDKYGIKYYKNKVREAIAKADEEGIEYQLPDDPWSRDWTTINVYDMFDEVGLKDLYDRAYRNASEWIHWGPQAILRATNSVEWGISGFTEEDWPVGSLAILVGCMSLELSLEALDDHFSLQLSERLVVINEMMTTALNESLAAAGSI